MKTKFLITASLLASGITMLAQIHQTGSTRTGFNTAAPANKVEITSDTGDPYFGSSNGSSGLRLTNMTNAKVPATNPSSGVLSVDAAGDVIFVADQSGSGAYAGAQNGCSDNGSNVVELGNALGGTSAQLLSHREIPMNRKNILFSGLTNDGVEQITLGAVPTVLGKFNVLAQEKTNISPAFSFAGSFENRYNSGNSVVGYFRSSQASDYQNKGIWCQVQKGQSNTGIHVEVNEGGDGGITGGFYEVNDGSAVTAFATGVSAYAKGSPGENCGVYGSATGNVGLTNKGGDFQAGSDTSITQSNIGIKSISGPRGTVNVAGHFIACASGLVNPMNPPSVLNYGIYAEAPAVVNYPMWTNSYAGYFSGDVHINGIGTSPFGVFTTSDRRIKKDINDIHSALDVLQKIKPKTYFFDKSFLPTMNVDEKKMQYGVIAQELEEILPELVTEVTTQSNYTKDFAEKKEFKRIKAVNYTGLIPILISAVNEQQQQIKELKELVNTLLQNSATDNKNNSTGNQTAANVGTPTTINVTDKNIIVLNQNVPNPFAESTEITYNIPQSFTKAQLIFSTNDGKVIKVVDVTEKGSGKLNVFANDLSHGMYSYQLVVDEKVIDTKKMIRE